MSDIDLISGNKSDSELNSREIKGILAREIVKKVVRGCLDEAVNLSKNLAKEIVNK